MNRFCLGFVLVLWPSVAGHAQTWTLDTAVRAARENNPSVRASDASVRRARAGERSEDARYALRLSGSAGFNGGQTPRLTLGQVITPYSEQYSVSATLSRTFDFGLQASLQTAVFRSLQRTIIIPTSAMIVELGPGYGIDTTLTLTQPLLRGWGTDIGRSGLYNAQASVSLESLRAASTTSALVRDTTLAFYELWYAQEALRIQRAAAETAARQLEEAVAREAIGVLAAPERLQFETRLRSLEEAVVVAQAQVRARSEELRRLTRAPEGLQIQAPDLDVQSFPTEDELLELAAQSSPELVVLRAQVALAETQGRIAGEEFRPRLDVQGQLAVHGLGYADAGNALNQLGTFAAVTGGITVSGDLELDDTRRHLAEEQAALATEVAERNWESGRDLLRAQIRIELESLRAAEERVRLGLRTTDTATQFLHAEEQRLGAGVRTATQIVLASDEVRNAELRVLRARVDASSSSVRLHHYIGTLTQ